MGSKVTDKFIIGGRLFGGCRRRHLVLYWYLWYQVDDWHLLQILTATCEL